MNPVSSVFPADAVKYINALQGRSSSLEIGGNNDTVMMKYTCIIRSCRSSRNRLPLAWRAKPSSGKQKKCATLASRVSCAGWCCLPDGFCDIKLDGNLGHSGHLGPCWPVSGALFNGANTSNVRFVASQSSCFKTPEAVSFG